MDIYIPKLLKDLLPKEQLSQCNTHHFDKGDYLFHQSKKPKYMFFIVADETVLTSTNRYGEPTT